MDFVAGEFLLGFVTGIGLYLLVTSVRDIIRPWVKSRGI